MKHLYYQGQKSKSRSNVLLLICTGLVLIVGAWLLLDYGKWRTIYQEMSEAITQRALVDAGPTEKEVQLMSELDELRKQITVLERTTQVDKTAQNEVRKIISGLESENLELREELGFFENILAAMDESRGLKIQAFRLISMIDKQRYQFELVLTRIDKGVTVSHGDVSILLQGKGNTAKVEYNIEELLAGEDSQLSYEIKHFKLLSGVFSLPEGFSPNTIQVMVKPRDKNAKSIEMLYQWINVLE